MLKKIQDALKDIIVVAIMSVLVTSSATYFVCLSDMWGYTLYCRSSEKYLISNSVAITFVFFSLFLNQYKKTKLHFEDKKRYGKPRPLYRPRYYQFFSQLGNADSVVDDENIGWLVSFDDQIDQFISRRELFNFLLQVCRIKHDIDNPKVSSPLSYSKHSLSRRKLTALRHILENGKVTKYVNANVTTVILDDAYDLLNMVESNYQPDSMR